MYSLLVNRTIPEDLGEDYFQNQLPDISKLPVKEVRIFDSFQILKVKVKNSRFFFKKINS